MGAGPLQLPQFHADSGALDRLLTILSRVRRGSLPIDDPYLGLGKRELMLHQQVASIRTRENRRALFRRGFLPGRASSGNCSSLVLIRAAFSLRN